MEKAGIEPGLQTQQARPLFNKLLAIPVLNYSNYLITRKLQTHLDAIIVVVQE